MQIQTYRNIASSGHLFILILYVEYFVLMCNNKDDSDVVKGYLLYSFGMSDLDVLHSYIGMGVLQSKK